MWSIVMPVSEIEDLNVYSEFFFFMCFKKKSLCKSNKFLLQIGVVAIISANAFMP